jgi:hypothetical protein
MLQRKIFAPKIDEIIIFGGVVNSNSIFFRMFYYYFIPTTCFGPYDYEIVIKTFRKNTVAIYGTPKGY